MRDRHELESIIKKYIKAPYSEELVKYIRPSVRLKSNKSIVEKIGVTKFGGAPDLPDTIEWPKSLGDNSPHSFLAQINLSEIKAFNTNELPSFGMLYFFYNFDIWENGAVIYTKDTANLSRVSIPQKLTFQKKRSFLARIFSAPPQRKVLPECSVVSSNEFSIPSWDSFFIEKIQLETNSSMRSIDIFKHDNDDFFSYLDEGQPRHRLLGHYDGVQNEYIETEFIESKFNYKKPNLATINKALKWRLLFQFDSDANMDLNIVDGGKIYFFIHEEDLKKNDFSKIKISIQFH